MLARVRTGVVVRAHGPGCGVCIITGAADADTAAALVADDIAAFDQRGCLSPRVVFVEGSEERGEVFARALFESLRALGERVPRGSLSPAEHADVIQWKDALAFAGHVSFDADHAVALVSASTPLLLPPPGRHVLVAFEPTLPRVAARLEPLARYVVAIGTDDRSRVAPFVPVAARLSLLGRMQRPPLDGPVDRRSA